MSNNIDKVKNALLSMQRYSWEQGVCAQAFLEMGEYDTVIALCYDAVNRQTPDGRLANLGGQSGVTDPVAILEPMVKSCELTNDEKMKSSLNRALEWALKTAPRSGKGIVYHVDNGSQFWVDSFYMLPPGLVKAGFAEEAVKQTDGYIETLYNFEKALFSHIWDEDNKKFIREDFWGVGNGWAICGLTRLIASLPKEFFESAEKYKLIVKNTIDAALKLMRDDYLFHDVLDNPGSFIEVNFAQMLCYAIMKGISGGYINPDLANTAEKIREAVNKNVSIHGFVENVCGAPHFNSAGIAPEGQAFYLLMETAFSQK